ncbi:imidazole glycerol phosphate synthase subunit HisH [Sebaldella sp. S0638]|uniref:imidazole glycerol phosphate synthase subunit HisH n=1 Tax=Sebaldella sp. S0638 TaxID=2957809 RepID=UPI0020A08C35|nr:imidazole glycerol phosphate synthase subunit HisH [Sebaldella sp. S0638]MCP1224977.1 imidazole glycerol phosphate synthase subunit HisH [Sebaldella sp. S0638]
MIAVVDYGVGNLFSLKSSLDYTGLQNIFTNNEEEIRNADALILPGVGAFRDAIDILNKTGLGNVVKEEAGKGKKVLGICLGMQLLFDRSHEYGDYKGLGLIKGDVVAMKDNIENKKLKIPHMGWNSLEFFKEDEILKYINEGEYVYYVHSYYAKNCDESVIACSDYEIKIPGIVKSNNIYGIQFHPEKSGKTGLNILKAFGEMI